MGIDKADIRYIDDYHVPKGYESYMQETGRAGRDEQPSVCELFACTNDATTLENFVYGDTPDVSAVRGLPLFGRCGEVPFAAVLASRSTNSQSRRG